MKALRRIIAIGMCGLVLGGLMSIMSASPATARIYRQCNAEVVQLEQTAARVFAQSKARYDQAANAYTQRPTLANRIIRDAMKSAHDATVRVYNQLMQQVAQHRVRWGC